MERMICVAPLFDDVTVYTFDESRDIVAYAEGKGVEVVDLSRKFAVRERVEATLEALPSVLLYHADHGNTDCLWGNDNRAVIDLNNVDLLVGRESYNNNCSSAKELGYEAWRRGCIAFWGYTDVVMFTTDAADEFKEAMNFGLKRKIDGFSWEECLEKTTQRMTELIDLLVQSGKVMGAVCMRHDRDCLVCYTPDVPPDEPSCPFSRLIVKLFGVKVLSVLRKIRSKIVG